MNNLEKINAKVLLGKLENGSPYIINLMNNPVVTIAGGSGTGKSHLMYSIVEDLVKTNTPEELNVVLFDDKSSSLWRMLSKEKHFTGYHTDTSTFTNVLEEVKSEHERRVKELFSKGLDSWDNYSDKDSCMPMLLVVIDELTPTMTKMRKEDAESYTKFRELLEQLSGVIRTTGIKIVLAGQRAGDMSIPKGCLANTTLKVGMLMNAKNDFTILFGNVLEKENIKFPQSRGEFIVTSYDYPTPLLVTATKPIIRRKYSVN